MIDKDAEISRLAADLARVLAHANFIALESLAFEVRIAALDNVANKAHLLLFAMRRDEWPGHNHTYVKDLREALAAACSAPETSAEPPYRQLWEAVAAHKADTFQCPQCGYAEDWWTDSNADYATRELLKASEPKTSAETGEKPLTADQQHELMESDIRKGRR